LTFYETINIFMMVESFITKSEGFKIKGVMHLPMQDSAPCVICSHGLFSSKESPKFIAIAEYLAEKGFVAIRYDHRGCGESEGKIEETTVSGRLKDLESVYIFSRRHPLVNGKIGLLGSSMGGFISLFTAACYPSLMALTVWATPFELHKTKKDLKGEGYPLLKESFYKDLNRHQLIDVLGKIKHCLVLHGQDDELIPLWHAKKNYKNLGEPKNLEIFPGGDHRFTDDHNRKRAIDLSAKWFKRYLV